MVIRGPSSMPVPRASAEWVERALPAAPTEGPGNVRAEPSPFGRGRRRRGDDRAEPESSRSHEPPIRQPSFAGVANRTLDGSRPDWGVIGDVDAPDWAPNALLGAGRRRRLRNPGTFGGRSARRTTRA